MATVRDVVVESPGASVPDSESGDSERTGSTRTVSAVGTPTLCSSRSLVVSARSFVYAPASTPSALILTETSALSDPARLPEAGLTSVM